MPAPTAADLDALARAGRADRELGELVGADALTSTDRRYLDFDAAFARELVDQRQDDNRTFDDALDRVWRVLLHLPRRELSMLPSTVLDAHPDGTGPLR